MSTTEQLMTGGCFCGDIRYQCQGPSLMSGLCLCRTCQQHSGGAGNLFMVVGATNFEFTQGEPRSYSSGRRPASPTRHFCGRCGIHLVARSAVAADAVLIKIGTLDDPGLYDGPELVVWTSEMQKFNLLPSGVTAFAEVPGR